MGSYNPNPVPDINPEKNKKKESHKKHNTGEISTISLLTNSVYYFIDCVFIAKLKNKYRLVVLQHRKVLFDKNYPSIKKCKIAFDEMFKEKAWSEEVNAEWSHFYDPDKDWIGKKCKYLES